MPDRYSPGMVVLGPGAPLTKVPTLNSILESAADYQLRRLGKQTGGRSGDSLSPDLVKVKNGNAAALRAGEVVELNGTPLGSVTAGYPWFNSANPNELRPFVVMLQDLPNDANAIGLAQISGICPALVNVQATTNLWAFRESGSRVLKGDHFWGDVRICSPLTTTGEQLVWVKIENSQQTWFGKIASTISKGTTGTVNICTLSDTSESDTGFTIPNCINRVRDLTSTSAIVVVNRVDRKPYVSPWDCG